MQVDLCSHERHDRETPPEMHCLNMTMIFVEIRYILGLAVTIWSAGETLSCPCWFDVEPYHVYISLLCFRSMDSVADNGTMLYGSGGLMGPTFFSLL